MKYILNSIMHHMMEIVVSAMGITIIVLGSIIFSKDQKQFKSIEIIQPNLKSLYSRDTLTIETVIDLDTCLFLYTNKEITLILKK